KPVFSHRGSSVGLAAKSSPAARPPGKMQERLFLGGPSLAGETRTVKAVCPHDCPDTCGMVVTVRDGRAVGLRGDADHPFTRGFLCQKVSRYLDRVYHADRLRWPLKRVGPKGRGRFERISWEEAIDPVAERFPRTAASP